MDRWDLGLLYLFFSAGFLFSACAFARKPDARVMSFPPQRLSAEAIASIEVRGLAGRLNLRGTGAKDYTIQVSQPRQPHWHVFVDRQANAWITYWQRELWPSLDILIQGPAVPAVVSWRTGLVRMRDWSQPADLSLSEGRVEVHRGRGALRVQAIDVEVSLFERDLADLRLHAQRSRIQRRQF
jgi:hypothetical protein